MGQRQGVRHKHTWPIEPLSYPKTMQGFIKQRTRYGGETDKYRTRKLSLRNEKHIIPYGLRASLWPTYAL